jgi:hypothetical protein
MATHKEELHEAITQLQQATKRGEMPREVRLGRIEAVVEDYFAKAGEMPASTALERLADLVLYEDLNNPSLTKMQDEESPIMSERQYDRRQSAEVATGNRMDNNAADGQRHIEPTRRKRSSYENLLLDKRARSRNKERKRKYAEFTKVQAVVHQHLTDFTDYKVE